MNYNDYKLTEFENGIEVENIRDFNLVHILECGQCFRWIKQDDGSYNGIVRRRAANVSFKDDKLYIKGANEKDFRDIWFEYFDLGRDYSLIKEKLSKDATLKKAIEFGYGIRLLKQDFREMLISFIISANNRIPMIMKTIDALSKNYGDEIDTFIGNAYSFPGYEKLSKAVLEELEMCKGGFRCKYIKETSGVVQKDDDYLLKITELTTENARKELQKLPGVGPKVADCVLLYSGTKYDVFPTDVWVKRVMEELYFKREASLKEIQEFSKEHFGELAGFAQQYLFYYARENKIGR